MSAPPRPDLPAIPAAGTTGRVLVLLAHPVLHKSRVNRPMAQAVRDLDGVTVHDLYEAYPDLMIDVGREQSLLAGHDVIIWQHPLYWYSTPSILKEWQDHVLTFGWAFGPGGDALAGKPLLQAVSVGGSPEAYSHTGVHGRTLPELLAPVAQTARLCGMIWRPPFVAWGVHRMAPDAVAAHAQAYRALLVALRDGTLDVSAWPEDAFLKADPQAAPAAGGA